MRNVAASLLICLSFLSKAQQTASHKGFQLFFEKIYLHTDREVYVQGDTLWFKAYLVNGQDNRLIASSSNLYVDLTATDATIAGAELIRLQGGLGAGEFELRDSLPPGKYRLRAYTNWMRNFGDNFIFEKGITILSKNIEEASNQKTLKAASNKKTATSEISAGHSAIQPIIRFFPESGSLIEGIGSRIAVKAQDRSGRGITARGVITTDLGDTLARFSCDTLGMGLFSLHPVAGQVYRARVLANNRHFSVDLPKALPGGVTLQVRQTDTILHVVVSVSESALIASHGKYTVAIKHRGQIILSQQFKPSQPQTLFKISTTSFPEGIASLTVYDEAGRPHCERLVYIHQKNVSESIKVATNKVSYKPGEKVEIQLKTNGHADLSVAVVDAGAGSDKQENIVSYLMLQSEIKGKIEHPQIYFDLTNVNRFKQLDLLLMTQGWRDFVWRRLADTALRISYPAETGINVSGAIANELNGKKLQGANVSLYASAATDTKLFSSSTDSLGRFSFSNVEFYGIQPVKLTSVGSKGMKTGTFYLDSLNTLPVKKVGDHLPTSVDSIDHAHMATIARRRAEPKLSITGKNVLKEVKIKRLRNTITGGVFTPWGPDQVFTIKPDDKQYKTLEWYLLQHAKGAQKSAIRDTSGVVFPGSDTVKYFSLVGESYRSRIKLLPPQLIINGREIDSEANVVAEVHRNFYYNLPIDKIKKVVLRRVVGTLSQQGANHIQIDRFLLYLTLTDDALLGFNHGTLEVRLKGYHQSRTFYKPLNEEEANRIGYRPTIYWEPNVETDASGEAKLQFYNTSKSGKIRVVVEGLSEKGRPVFDVQDCLIE